jgi:ribosomal protein S10
LESLWADFDTRAESSSPTSTSIRYAAMLLVQSYRSLTRFSTSTLEEDADNDEIRLPRNVQAIYLAPLRRKAEYGVPSCDLQLRSYSVRNLEFFSDFALRAAYYLKLPAFGPVPLPRITERWTVPRSNFVFKKSQENFERITMRRLIQIKDGNPETVELWLAFLRKHAYHGVGMKANIWNYEELGKLNIFLIQRLLLTALKGLERLWMSVWNQLRLKWSQNGHTLVASDLQRQLKRLWN